MGRSCFCTIPSKCSSGMLSGAKRIVFDAMDNFLALKHFEPVHEPLKRYYATIATEATKIFVVTDKAAQNLFPYSART